MDNLINLDSDKGEQPGPSNIAAVNLPEFFIADPALWFVKAEAMFQAKRVKSVPDEVHIYRLTHSDDCGNAGLGASNQPPRD